MGECIDKRIPWMVWDAIARLEQALRPNMRVFEWGSGGSTLFWLKHGCSVVSIDHTPGWPKKVLDRVAEKNRHRLDIRHVRTTPGKCHDFASHVTSGCFRDYVTVIDGLGKFDIICVDGRARNACLRRAISHVEPDGLLILDNSDRTRYEPAIQDVMKAGFHANVLKGTGPEGNGIQWCTTFFSRGLHAAFGP